VVERNYRTRYGEIDLISRKEDALVFVEVKLRRGRGYGDPLEAVTPRKQYAIRSMAEQYLAEHDPEYDELRFDVIGILAGGGPPEINHVEGAF
jgi:putative endonuclease